LQPRGGDVDNAFADAPMLPLPETLLGRRILFDRTERTRVRWTETGSLRRLALARSHQVREELTYGSWCSRETVLQAYGSAAALARERAAARERWTLPHIRHARRAATSGATRRAWRAQQRAGRRRVAARSRRSSCRRVAVRAGCGSACAAASFAGATRGATADRWAAMRDGPLRGDDAAAVFTPGAQYAPAAAAEARRMLTDGVGRTSRAPVSTHRSLTTLRCAPRAARAARARSSPRAR
jgi:hypothetical protein